MYLPDRFFRPLNALPSLMARTRFARGTVLALIAVATLGVLVYVGAAVVDTVSRDEWRFFGLLRAWYGGHFYVQDLFDTNTVQSAHRTPAFKLFFLLNALWFGLDVRVGCYLGAAALGAFALLLYRYFLRIRPEPATAFDHYAFLPVALTVFSFTQAHIYSYELLAFFTIVGSVVFAALWMRMDLGFRAADPGWRYVLLGAALFAALLLFGAGKGPALALATVAAAALLASRGTGPWRISAAPMAWIAACALAAQLVYWGGGASTVNTPAMSGLVGSSLANLAGSLGYVLHALGASLVSTDALALLPSPLQDSAYTSLGGVVLAAAVGAFAIYLRTRMYRRSVLPLALAVFVAGYLAELLVGRFGEGTLNGGSPRYVYTDHLLVVACVLVFADMARGWRRAGRRRAATGALATLLLVIAGVEGLNLYASVASLGFGVHAQEKAVAVAKARLAGSQERYPEWYCPDVQSCDEGTRFLAEHHLNLFRPGADARP